MKCCVLNCKNVMIMCGKICLLLATITQDCFVLTLFMI